jgi:hypothetical protein
MLTLLPVLLQSPRMLELADTILRESDIEPDGEAQGTKLVQSGGSPTALGR